MNSLIVLLLAISCVHSASIPEVSNPCVDSELYFLRYFQPYPLDEHKYIQCDPWYGMSVKDCPYSTTWNNWYGVCTNSSIESSLNVTSNFTDAPVVPPVVFNETCKYWGNDTCLNHGICNVLPFGGKCMCSSNYSGDFCGVYNESSWGVFSQLINSSFNLEEYRKLRPLQEDYYVYNGTLDLSLVTDNVTKERISQYLALYPNGTMRFDVLVNYLVQDYLSLIYPWQFFLQEFSYPSEMQMGYVNSIPGLLMSSKYAYDRFDDMWLIYNDVLQRLVKYLPQYLPNIRNESLLFYQIYDSIFTQFERTSNFSQWYVDQDFGNVSVITVDMIKSKLRRDFNRTLSYSYDLFNSLRCLDDEIGLRSMTYNASFFEETISNFTTSPNVTTLLSELSDSSAEIWDSLSFYGFWYVVSEYVDRSVLNETRQGDLVLNGSAVARVLGPAFSPKNKTMVPIFQALVSGDNDDFNGTVTNLDDFSSERLVADLNKTTVVVPKPEKLVGKLNETVVVPKPEKLSSDETTTTMAPIFKTERLVGKLNETLVVPKPEKLSSETTTTAKTTTTTMVPSFKTERLIGKLNETVVVPKPEKLSSETTTTTVVPAVVVVPKPEKLVGKLNETVVVPKPEKLSSETETTTTTVMPVSNESEFDREVGEPDWDNL